MSPQFANLYGANQLRSRNAARAKAARARQALEIIDANTGNTEIERENVRRHRTVLMVRVMDPDASLLQLAESIGMTKFEYAARLRRALDYADTKAGKL